MLMDLIFFLLLNLQLALLVPGNSGKARDLAQWLKGIPGECKVVNSISGTKTTTTNLSDRSGGKSGHPCLVSDTREDIEDFY